MDAIQRQWAIERFGDLMVRLDELRWPSRSIPTVPAGAVSASALELLEKSVRQIAHRLRRMAASTQQGLRCHALAPSEVQQKVVAAQLQVDALFRTVDLYSDAIVTRTDAQVALLLAGTDELLRDALARPVAGYTAPAAVCHLDSGGRGGAINRARTRLPGGIVLPVALVRVSPESLPARLSSCLHEAGHQLSVDLHMLDEARAVIENAAAAHCRSSSAARIWGTWTSELLADCWNIGLSGGAPGVDGLQRLLSLPNAWLLRIIPGDPHPPGYLRNRFALALARIWHPHPVLGALRQRFEFELPDSDEASEVATLDEATLPIAKALASHRFRTLSATMAEACEIGALAPHRAAAALRTLNTTRFRRHRPLLALAALGFGRVTGILTPRSYRAAAHGWLTQLAQGRFAASTGRSDHCHCHPSIEVPCHV